jgi:putative ABC transport system permease protein
VSCFDLFPSVFEDAEIPVFVVMGVVLTGAAVGLVSINQDLIGRAVRRVGGGSRSMALRLGLAYPLARKFRTGMILSMYSLVVFTLVFMTVFSYLFSQQVDHFTAQMSGGFDVRVASNASSPIPPDQVRALPEVTAVGTVTSALAQFQQTCPGCSRDFVNWPVSSMDAELQRVGAPELNARLPEFPDDAAAYRRLATDPDAFIPSNFFLQNGGGPPTKRVRPGDVVVLKDPVSGRTRSLHVIATAETGPATPLVFVAPAVLQDMFTGRAAPDLLYVALRAGVDGAAFAAGVNGRFVANGADAQSFRSLVSDILSQQNQFFRLIRGYLALGLLVGIAGLGVVMVRAVRERRRQIGVLRALGFQAAVVRRAFLAESAFVAAEGIFIGTGLALVTAWRLVGNDTFGAALDFSVPVAQLAVLVLGTFVASLIATVTPAQQASRIKPAVALRIAD